MKKFLAALLMCAMLMTLSAPITALAVEGEDFVPSAEQAGPVDEEPQAPQTGEALPIIPVAGAAVFAVAAVVFFAVAAKKQKN